MDTNQLTQLGFQPQQNGAELTAQKTFQSATEAAQALVAVKQQLLGQGMQVQSEQIQGDNVVCTFTGQNGEQVITTQQVAQLGLQITATGGQQDQAAQQQGQQQDQVAQQQQQQAAQQQQQAAQQQQGQAPAAPAPGQPPQQ